MNTVDGRIKGLFETLISAAVNAKASDIHLSPTARPQLRVNGHLQPVTEYVLTPEDTNKLASFIMSADQRDQVVHGDIGDGDFAISYNDYRFRGNTAKTRKGLVIALRFLPRQIPSMSELGLPYKTIIRLLSSQRGGIFLITGPTGSGKTTTMASMVDYINSNFHQHIVTIEAPVEYEHEHKKSNVDQRELPADSPSFGSALRAALREDPDTIMVGEMRDLETIATAITAAETGHLVFSTLHTNSAIETINRAIDVFPAGQQAQIRAQVSMALMAVLSQRLIPRADGRGRVAAFELLINNTAVSNLIRENKAPQIASVMQTSKGEGMICFNDSLTLLVGAGVISREQARLYAIDPKNFQI